MTLRVGHGPLLLESRWEIRGPHAEITPLYSVMRAAFDKTYVVSDLASKGRCFNHSTTSDMTVCGLAS